MKVLRFTGSQVHRNGNFETTGLILKPQCVMFPVCLHEMFNHDVFTDNAFPLIWFLHLNVVLKTTDWFDFKCFVLMILILDFFRVLFVF